MPKILNAMASEADQGTRLDAFLAASFDISRSAAERLIGEGAVEITGGKADKKYRLKGGEQVTLTLPSSCPWGWGSFAFLAKATDNALKKQGITMPSCR